MIKQWKGKQTVSIILHHIPPLGLSLLFLSLPLISKRKREGRDKGERMDKEECHFLCALFCLSIFSIHLSSILFFDLPIKKAILFFSPLSFSLPPLLLFPCKRQKRKKGRIRGEWREALFLSSPLSMDGGSGRSWLLARRPSPCFSKPLLSPYRLCSFPCAQAKNENGFLYMFIVLPFVFYFKGKEPEKKDKNER